MTKLHIGIDIDNTIIDYGDVFGSAGEEIGLLPHGHSLRSKAEVRAFLMTGSGGEAAWMKLQGQVYGRFIERATLFPGVADFLRMTRSKGARVSLISHKTRYGHFDIDRIDLWNAALGWLTTRGFFAAEQFDLTKDDVYFLETRDEKVAKVAQIHCNVFIDDLPEVLAHDDFPASVRKIWFADPKESNGDLSGHGDWTKITTTVTALLADAAP